MIVILNISVVISVGYLTCMLYFKYFKAMIDLFSYVKNS